MKIGLSDKYWKKIVISAHDPAYIAEENKRLARQALCKHDITVTFRKYEKFSERCEQCHLILRSDATEAAEIKINEQIL